MSLLTALLLLLTCFADGEAASAPTSWQEAPRSGDHAPVGLAGDVESEQENDEDPESFNADEAHAAAGVASGGVGASRGVTQAEQSLRHTHGPRPYAARAPPTKA